MVAGIFHSSPSAIFRIVPRRILPERVLGRRETATAVLKAATGPILSVTDLPKEFRSRGRSEPLTAVDHVSFTVPSGTTRVRTRLCYDQPDLPTSAQIKHTLDLGIYQARGADGTYGADEFRGWGGSSRPNVRDGVHWIDW